MEKNRLIDLMKKTVVGVEYGHKVLAETIWLPRVFEAMADRLLTNGVIVPPIGLGRTCFDVRAKCVDECRVSSVTQKADGSLKVRITNLRYRAAYEITPDEIGKTVFLTCEEAEKALAEREE